MFEYFVTTKMKIEHTHGRADRHGYETDVEYVVDADHGQIGCRLGCIVRND